MRTLALLLISSFLLSFEIVFPPIQSLMQMPVELDPSPRLKTGWEVQIFWANLFEEKGNFTADFELMKVNFLARLPLDNQTEAELLLAGCFSSGGLLDPLIDGFHRTFGFADAGRSNYDSFRSLLRLEYRGREAIKVQGWHMGFFSPHVFLKRTVPLPEGKILVRAGLKLPLNGLPEGLDYSLLSAGLELSYLRDFKKGRFLLSYSQFINSKPSFIEKQDFRSYTSRLLFSLTFKKFILSFSTRSSPFRVENLSARANTISLGYRPKPGIIIGITEDMAPYDTSADITFFLILKH